ncbi:MAG: cyclic pyranopterin monophosphate synthase MoaC [Verrucomicrobia bacterium]|nr:cyclic pyranopterin monophosphate synthase MoaC [Verrucomicrobiota bacterium]
MSDEAFELTHLRGDGSAVMVDVSRKPIEKRVALAEGLIRLQPATLAQINRSGIAKGNVLLVARVAAIAAVKRTDELIPLCHSLPVQHVRVDFEEEAEALRIECEVVTTAQTGVEMEALTGVTVAALTVYDMCKAVDKAMVIDGVRLLSKRKLPAS